MPCCLPPGNQEKYEHKHFLAFNNTRSTKRAGGGVFILIHKSLIPYTTPIKCKEDSYIITIRISKTFIGSNSDLISVCCYISPSCTPYPSLNELITKLSTKNDSEIIVCGAFNARTADLDDTTKHIDIHLPVQLPKALDLPHYHKSSTS